ncbi:MAG: hypothetical protein PHY46_05220 [Candidatus Omnitrophica bacterium]|nr:hypothetical protein [Candidatus Omnitrophota bacterium]
MSRKEVEKITLKSILTDYLGEYDLLKAFIKPMEQSILAWHRGKLEKLLAKLVKESLRNKQDWQATFNTIQDELNKARPTRKEIADGIKPI